MKKVLIICMLTIFLQLFSVFFTKPAQAIDIGEDCGFDQINLSDEVGQVFNERIEAVLRSVTTGKSLFGGLIFLAVISLYLDYLRGQLDWKGFVIRVGVTIFLLKSYTGEGNFRDVINNAANKAADSIQFGYPGGNALEAMFETLYRMFKNLQGGSGTPGSVRVINWLGNLFGIGEIGDAAHVVALFFSPAGITTILFILTTLIVAILSYVLDVGATLLLLVLSLLGPIAICFCSIRSTMSIATGWFQRFVEINLWKIIYACFMVGIATVYEKLGAIAFNPEQYANATDPLTQMTCAFSAMLLSIVVAVVSIFMLSSIPSIASAIVEGRGHGMGMTASFLVGAGAASVMNGVRSGFGTLRQKVATRNSSRSSNDGGTEPPLIPFKNTATSGSNMNRDGSSSSGFHIQRNGSSKKLAKHKIDDSKSESSALTENTEVTKSSADNPGTEKSELQKFTVANKITHALQKFGNKNEKRAQVERIHISSQGTQVSTISKQGFLGRKHYTTTTTDNTGKITKKEDAIDSIEAAKNHRDQLRENRSTGEKFIHQWMPTKSNNIKTHSPFRFIASSDDGKISISDFRDRDGKTYMQTMNNKTGEVTMRTRIRLDLDARDAFHNHMIKASTAGQTFRTSQGSKAIAVSKSIGSDQSSIMVYRTTDNKLAVQEKSGKGEVKRSHVAVSAKESLRIRDDWKNEGSRNSVSYVNHDLSSQDSEETPSRIHQSDDGELLLTTTKGRDHQGKESYLIEKINIKTGKTQLTTASNVAEAEQKHNHLLQVEHQTGREFKEIKTNE